MQTHTPEKFIDRRASSYWPAPCSGTNRPASRWRRAHVTAAHASRPSKQLWPHNTIYQSFPRLGSLRGCERAHVLVVRTCKHLVSVHPRVEKVRPHESRWKMLSRCISPTEKNTIKQLNWDYPPCAGFRKRYVGRIVACLKNAIIRVTMPYIDSTLSVIKNVMITR